MAIIRSTDPVHTPYAPPAPRPRVSEQPALDFFRSSQTSPTAPALTARVAPVQLADPFFRYASPAPRDQTQAQAWWPGKTLTSGTQANATINGDYHQLNANMQTYLGGNPGAAKLPAVADWTSFGKYASREAGEQIRNLEDVMKAYEGSAQGAADVARNMANLDQITQGLLLGGNSAARNGANLPEISGDLVTKLGKMRNALVEGNTEIHKNIAPAYDAFLSGESSGQKGLESLAAAGYTPGSAKDPQGFVTQGFESYKQARGLGLQAQRETDPNRQQALLKQRQELMEKGNLYIGLQEQMEILQRPAIFGDKDMKQAMAAVAGTMSLTDANGKHALRPDGKNWTDFAARMGLKPCAADAPGAISVKDKQGVLTHYLPDLTQKGTILEYFTQNASGTAADNLNRNAPRPLVVGPTSGTGQAVDQLARQIDQGNLTGSLRAAQSLPLRVAGDGMREGGGGLQAGGQLLTGSGLSQMADGLQQGGVRGYARASGGALQMGMGVVAGQVGQKLSFWGGVADLAGSILGR
ncbi:hypothetical protein ABS71_01575 [bacterium SCN 62-11]|nr:MAG: hypothetical protein ABS71_01575 [bacterium SCN 62-11]